MASKTEITATASPSGNSTVYTSPGGQQYVVRNRNTASNVPDAGTGSTSPYTAEQYQQWHDEDMARRLKTEPSTYNDDINPGDTRLGGGLGSGRGGGGGSSAGGASGGSYTAPTLPTATDQSAYINAMYAANEAAARENLRSEYENNLAELDRAQGRLPDAYNAAVDQANAQAAINRANFNEAAAANGINTGAGSQVRLSQNNALQGNVASIRKAQADAQSDLDFQRTQLEAQYQQAIRDAIAKNDLEKAQALYQEARRVDESIVNTAINQANLNWSVWKSLYK